MMAVFKKLDTDIAPPRSSHCPNHGKYISSFIPLLANWTKCPECSRIKTEKELQEKKREKELEQQRKIERIFARSSIPKRYIAENFDTYLVHNNPDIAEQQRRALATLFDFANNFSSHLEKGTNLILAGWTGTGKGHLAISAAKRIAEKGHSVFFTTLAEMILTLRSSWVKSPGAPSESETLKALCSASLLIIDDVGVGFNSESERTQLFSVINRRYLDLMPTIFTTNLTTRELEEVMGERNFSRVRQNGKWVSFEWEDYRASKHLKLASSNEPFETKMQNLL